jgi:branched-chain amino acid transport system ATP-binding protein
MLKVRNLEVVYNDVSLVLRGVSLDVRDGSIAALLGANGAGKTTLLRAITGLLFVHRGAITKGSVEFEGRDITNADPASVVCGGITQVMEGRRVFAEVSVDENLKSGAFTRSSRGEVAESYARVMEMFPALASRRKSVAGYLSGGEQQMVAIGRALMAAPRLLILDEPSLGLAPKIVEQVANVIVEINRQGTSVLLVEQNAAMALAVADHGYVMETGKVALEGPAEELRDNADVSEFYLGGGHDGQRRSFAEIKTYRRKKRWSA